MEDAALNERILTGLVIVIALGSAAQWAASRLRVPSILLLLLVGFVAGPLTGLLDPDALLGAVTFPLVSLGAAMVLFEGGLSTRWHDIRSVAAPVRRLITIGLVVTWVGAGLFAHALLDLPLDLAALLGAILVVTGPTVVGPLLHHARPHGQVAPILKLEGILNDPMGAVLAVLTFQIIQTERVDTALSLMVFGVLKAALLGSVLGLAAAWSYVKAHQRGWISTSLENAVLIPLALVVYASANALQHESGLLAVTVMGIALASQSKVNIDASVEFTEHARTMLISVLFVLLTARMELSDLTEMPPAAFLFVGALILLVRPLSVCASTWGTKLTWRERLFLSAMAPRGVVAAAVSSLFALRLVDAGYEQARILMPITFTAIAICVVVYGLGASPLVRLLGLAQQTPRGVLILGANAIGLELALALRGAGVRALLVDADRNKVMKARALGLSAEHGRLLSEHVLNRLDLDDIGYFVAVTPSDDANTLAVAHFRGVFGDDHVFQVRTGRSRGPLTRPYAKALRGRAFAQGKSYDELEQLAHRGGAGKVTLLTDAFSFGDYQREHAVGALPLFALTPSDELRALDGEAPPPHAGERVVGLVCSQA